MNTNKFGIYGYLNLEGEVVYIGKDSSLHTNHRDIEHKSDSHLHRQLINKKLREEDLEYIILATCINKEFMNFVESRAIEYFKPKYNELGGKKHA